MRRSAGEAIRIAVLGAGSWGTAIARLLHANGHRVALWSFEESVVRIMREEGENRIYLPGISIPGDLAISHRLEEVVPGARIVVSVNPAQHVRSVMAEAAPHLDPDAVVVSASKGIELASRLRMDEVLASVLPADHGRRLVVLSGPSFAAEVARGHPTAVVAAGPSEAARTLVQEAFGSSTFRVYTNPDIVGVEIGGAVKNVVALAAGVSAGLGFGHNTIAALVTRGLAEIARLAEALGARAATVYGLAGLGDLVLTCTGDLSRNRAVGVRLGKGERLDAIVSEMRAVAEGVPTAPAVRALAREHRVEMPIVEAVCEILEGTVDPREAVERLMLREPRAEG